MAKSHVIYEGFRAGEFSPQLDGQISFEKYYQACKKLENFIPTVQGPVCNRPGLRYIASAKYSDKKCRLVPFEFSTEQTYILEFGHQYIRFYKNQGQILSAGVPYEISTTYTESELPEMQFIQSLDILFIVHPNHPPRRLSRTGDTSWTLSDILFLKKYYPTSGMLSTNFDRYTLGSEKVKNGGFDVDAEWTKGINWSIANGVATKVAGDADTLSQDTSEVAGEKYKVTYTVTKTAGTGITASIGARAGTQRTASGTYTEYIDAITADNLTFTPTTDFTGSVDNVSVKKATIIDYADFIDGSIGTKAWDNDTNSLNTFLQLDLGANKEILKIKLYIAYAELNATFDIEYSTDGITWSKAHIGWNLAGKGLGWVEVEWSSAGAKRYWRLLKTNAAQAGGSVMEIEFHEKGNPSVWTAGKYPSCITFFEERLWLASLQTIWGSRSGDYYNLTTGTNDDDAIEYTISSNQMNKIHFISSGKILAIGTAVDIYKMSASELDEAITPLNVRIVREVSLKGAAFMEAISINNGVLYLSRSKRKIREFTFNSENNSYVSPDMSILAEHLFTNKEIRYICYQPEPFSCLWAVRNDGVLLGFSYYRQEGITAWHRHTTDGFFESVASVYGADGNHELWSVVKRTIGGVDKRYVEMMKQPFDDETLDSNECFFVDSGLTYNGAPTATISGLGHLEGKTVAVLADGVVQTSKVVSGGSITLDTAASRVHAGLAYSSILQTMRLERKDEKGTAQGRKGRINQAVIRFYKTKQFKYGSTPDGTLIEKIFDSLYSGDCEIDQVLGWDRGKYITIKNEKPLPCTIVVIVAELDVQ